MNVALNYLILQFLNRVHAKMTKLNEFHHLKITVGCITHFSMKMSCEQNFCCLMVYKIFYEIYHFNYLIFTTFIICCAVLRSFDGKSVNVSFKFAKR